MKKNHIKTAVILVLVFLSVSCSAQERGSSASSMASAFTQARIPLLRQAAEARDFSLPLVSGNGDTLSLSDLRGQVVFVNFWATWCAPCRDEMPSMESLYRQFRDRGLEIIAVNIQENEQDVADFMRDYGLTFPALLDLNGRVSSNYGVQAIPTSYLIDREGNIVVRKVGSIDWDTQEIRSAIEMLLNQ